MYTQSVEVNRWVKSEKERRIVLQLNPVSPLYKKIRRNFDPYSYTILRSINLYPSSGDS